MIYESLRVGRDSISALKKAVEGNRRTWLTKGQSERNIACNLVTVAAFDGGESLHGSLAQMNSKSHGTGFLLTMDGFVITAYHNIAPHVEHWQIINKLNPPTKDNAESWLADMTFKYAVIGQNRNAYPIDTTFWRANEALDIALIKAVIPGKRKPIKFRIETHGLKAGDEIKLLALNGQTPYCTAGRVTYPDYDAVVSGPKNAEMPYTTLDTFLTDARCTAGNSGGVFITPRGELAGMALYYTRPRGKDAYGLGGGAKARHIVNLVKESAHQLEEMFQK